VRKRFSHPCARIGLSERCFVNSFNIYRHNRAAFRTNCELRGSLPSCVPSHSARSTRFLYERALAILAKTIYRELRHYGFEALLSNSWRLAR